AQGTDLIIADGGRSSCQTAVDAALRAGRRALVADIFGTGEMGVRWQHQMLVATTGLRPLGLQVGHLIALGEWAGKRHGIPRIVAHGRTVSATALIACALRPHLAAGLQTHDLLDSLARLIQWPAPYSATPGLFCFGLLAEFDIEDFIALSAPMPITDANGGRGPLRTAG
ncbi:MAG: hypothetical protein VXW00_03475, partial [Candidatus Latescibacterota bacterium]|nr:hypothetical protein [Candidatus Latescibacterota bacterium]